MEQEIKGCPFCGGQPTFNEIVEGKVWIGACKAIAVNHQYNVMSWEGLDHCQKLWNSRHGDDE